MERISITPYSNNSLISFGTKKEKQMLKEFMYHNIIIYDPNQSSNIERWKAFINSYIIKFNKIDDVKKELSNEKIKYTIITVDEYEKLESETRNNSNVAEIIIYSNKDIKKLNDQIKQAKNEDELFEILLKKNKEFAEKITVTLKYIKNKDKFNFKHFEYETGKVIDEKFRKNTFDKIDKYEKFCRKLFNDWNISKIDFEKTSNYFWGEFRIIYLLYILSMDGANFDTLKSEIFYENELKNLFNNFSYNIDNRYITNKLLRNYYYENKKETNFKFLKNFNLFSVISLFFCKFPYIFGFFSYEEVEKNLNLQVDARFLNSEFWNFCVIIETCVKCIDKTINIFEQTNYFNALHIKLIQFCKFFILLELPKETDQNKFENFFHDFYVIYCFSDIDFCLKFLMKKICFFFSNEIYNECNYVSDFDVRITNVEKYIYLYSSFVDNDKSKTMGETLRFKDILVIGDTSFHNKIRKIEKNLNPNSINYLEIKDMMNYLFQKEKKVFKYYLIINDTHAENLYEELNSIEYLAKIIINVIVLVEKKDKLISKFSLIKPGNLPVIITRNLNDVKNYINRKNIICSELFNDFIIDNINEKLNNDNKITLFKDKEKYDELTGWEFIDNILYDKIIFKSEENIFINDNLLIYYLLDKKYMTDLYFSKYCDYFSIYLNPEIESFNSKLVQAEKFLYALKENDNEQNFLDIINEELKSGNLGIISCFLNIINNFKSMIAKRYLKVFKQKTYKCLKFSEKFLKKLKEKEKKEITNLYFLTMNKNEKTELEISRDENSDINVFLSIKGEINVISPISMDEVIFLPFSKFKIEKIEENKIFENKKIFLIDLIQTDKREMVNNNTENNINVEKINGKKILGDIDENIGGKPLENFEKLKRDFNFSGKENNTNNGDNELNTLVILDNYC